MGYPPPKYQGEQLGVPERGAPVLDLMFLITGP